MNIKIIAHVFGGFVPIEGDSLFLDVKCEPEKVEDIMKEIHSDAMKILCMVTYGNLREKKNEEYGEDRSANVYKQAEIAYELSRKYIDCIKTKNREMYKEMLKWRGQYLTKDIMKMIADKWLNKLEEERKKVGRGKLDWRVIGAEIVRETCYDENEIAEYEWNVYPIEDMMLSVIKLLHKALCHMVMNAWLYTGDKIKISLRKYDNDKMCVHLQCPKGELFDKCVAFTQSFLKDYIIEN